jgi:hypothetical protein
MLHGFISSFIIDRATSRPSQRPINSDIAEGRWPYESLKTVKSYPSIYAGLKL